MGSNYSGRQVNKSSWIYLWFSLSSPLVLPPPTPHRRCMAGHGGRGLVRPDRRARWPPAKPCAGGAVTTSPARWACRALGTQYLNPLSGDMLGRQLARGLHDAERGPGRAHAGACAQCAGAGRAGCRGKASYSFYRDGVADRQVTAAALNAAHAPHCLSCRWWLRAAWRWWRGTPPSTSPGWRHSAAGRMVVVDANLRLSAVDDAEAYRANVMAALQHAHLIKVSDDDLEALAVPGATALERAHYFAAANAGAMDCAHARAGRRLAAAARWAGRACAKMRRSRWWTRWGRATVFWQG